MRGSDTCEKQNFVVHLRQARWHVSPATVRDATIEKWANLATLHRRDGRGSLVAAS